MCADEDFLPLNGQKQFFTKLLYFLTVRINCTSMALSVFNHTSMGDQVS